MVWPNSAGNSAPDPFMFNASSIVPDNDDLANLTRVSPAIPTGQVVEAVLSIGNSIVCSSVTDAAHTIPPPLYTPTNTLIQMMQLRSGVLFTAKEPVITTGLSVNSSHSVWLRFADLRRSAGKCDRWVGLMAGVGGTLAADWAPGGFLQTRALAASRRLRANGFTNHLIHMHFGENERYLADIGGDASYAANFRTTMAALIQALRDDGATGVIYLSRGAWIAGGTGAHSAGLQADIDALVNGTTIKYGANIDDLDNSYRQDTTHLNFTSGSPLYASRLHTAAG